MSKNILTKSIPISNGYSGTITLLAESDVEGYVIVPASPCTLGGNAVIALSGTPVKGMRLHFTLSGAITISTHTFTILGNSIGAKQMASGFDLLMEYNGTAWVPFLRQDFLKTGFIGGDKLASDVVDNSTLELNAGVLRVKDLGISMEKLANFGAEAHLIISDETGAPHVIAITGDVTITKDGLVTIANDAVTTAKILDKNVTLGKMADLSEGSILIGNSSSRPVAISCKASGYLLLGNGTTAVAVTLSGDVTISSSGAVTIANDAITTGKILDEAVTLGKIANIGAAKIIVGNASGVPTAVSLSGDVTVSNAGVMTIANNAITTAKILDGAITPAKMSVVKPSTGYAQGVLSMKTIDSTRLKALLDTTTNELFSVNAGEIVVAVQVYVQTAHALAAAAAVGVDANARTAGADADGLIKTLDLNTKGLYKSDDEANYGALQEFGYFEADGNGFITITSTVDCSSGAFVGGAVMYYIAKG